ncbi:hypothetical protein NUH30_18675 [Leptospira sp. 85282-16]|uniref:hypothetical protein n=1 Tax=Leptospira sp. 85282-16 TaxID=2971256 RepID=UPI0021BF9690|nr:hypothetical protein [Leptospira sp. 85282-16]MCT8335717.1 hypothetical protein [Leptospira sp. 85282-16]
MKLIDRLRLLIQAHAPTLIFSVIGILVILLFSESLKDLFHSPRVPVVIQNSGKKANYGPDITFLECLGIQHSCIYDNIRSETEKFIIENCEDENFCTLEISNNKNRKRK